MRSGPLKLVTATNTFTQPPALYNLATDIAEGQNLAAAQPAEVASLNNLYTQWSKKLISPLWMGTSSGSATTLAKLTLAGDWNAFNKDDSSPPWQLTLINAPDPNGTPDGFEWLVNTIHVAATGGDTMPGLHSFTLVANGSYLHQWKVTVTDSTTLSPPFHRRSGRRQHLLGRRLRYLPHHQAHACRRSSDVGNETSTTWVTVGQMSKRQSRLTSQWPVF